MQAQAVESNAPMVSPLPRAFGVVGALLPLLVLWATTWAGLRSYDAWAFSASAVGFVSRASACWCETRTLVCIRWSRSGSATFNADPGASFSSYRAGAAGAGDARLRGTGRGCSADLERTDSCSRFARDHCCGSSAHSAGGGVAIIAGRGRQLFLIRRSCVIVVLGTIVGIAMVALALGAASASRAVLDDAGARWTTAGHSRCTISASGMISGSPARGIQTISGEPHPRPRSAAPSITRVRGLGEQPRWDVDAQAVVSRAGSSFAWIGRGRRAPVRDQSSIPTQGDSPEYSTQRRPILVDIDSDGMQEVIGLRWDSTDESRALFVTAHDGASHRPLWSTDPIPSQWMSPQTQLVRSADVLFLNDSERRLHFHDVATCRALREPLGWMA
jgi:hypothetical protein